MHRAAAVQKIESARAGDCVMTEVGFALLCFALRPFMPRQYGQGTHIYKGPLESLFPKSCPHVTSFSIAWMDESGWKWMNVCLT